MKEIVVNNLDDFAQLVMAAQEGGKWRLGSVSNVGLKDPHSRRVTFLPNEAFEPPQSPQGVDKPPSYKEMRGIFRDFDENPLRQEDIDFALEVMEKQWPGYRNAKMIIRQALSQPRTAESPLDEMTRLAQENGEYDPPFHNPLDKAHVENCAECREPAAEELPDFERDDDFVYDPGTGFFHCDDGGAPDHGIKWVREPADIEGLEWAICVLDPPRRADPNSNDNMKEDREKAIQILLQAARAQMGRKS